MPILLSLFLTFFKIGAVGFGGGYAMLSMITTELYKFGISVPQFGDLVALSLITPGPIAINSATFVGFVSAGVAGASVATIAVCAPAYVIIALVRRSIEKFRSSSWMQGLLDGIKPAAVGLIAAAAYSIGSGEIMSSGRLSVPIMNFNISFSAVILFIAVLVAAVKFKMHPILLTIAAGILGILIL